MGNVKLLVYGLAFCALANTFNWVPKINRETLNRALCLRGEKTCLTNHEVGRL